MGREKMAPKKNIKKATPKKGAAKAKKEKKPYKGTCSAFMFFSKANRDKIQKDHPGCSFGEVGKYLGEAWGKLKESPSTRSWLQQTPYATRRTRRSTVTRIVR